MYKHFSDVFKGIYKDKIFPLIVRPYDDKKQILLEFTDKAELLHKTAGVDYLEIEIIDDNLKLKAEDILNTRFISSKLIIHTNNTMGLTNENGLLPYLYFDTLDFQLMLEQINHYFNYPSKIYFSQSNVTKRNN